MGIREAALRMAASAPCTLQLGCCQRHPHACQASELVAALQLGSHSAPLPSDRFALVLCGGVSLLYRSAKGTMARASSEAGLAANGFGVVVNSSSNPLYNGGFPPTPLHITLSSLRQHIIDANDRSGGGRFDLFAHSWAPNLEGAYRRHFNFTSAVFEDNRHYEEEWWAGGRRGIYHNGSDWHQISYALSMSKAAQLVLDHAARMAAERPSWRFYSRVVFVRADVVLTRDLTFVDRPAAARVVYVSGPYQPTLTWRHLSGEHFTGDIHHIFSTIEQLRLCSRLPQLLAERHEAHAMHSWMWRTLTAATRGTRTELLVQTDGFVQGWDEEVYRRLPIASMRIAMQRTPSLRAVRRG